ncbi:hypothetical protein KJ359_001707 [Pestalotiopsis sp. 9143b]|nr:hypothetical protein KJ359_001707 [Pestalotiopsis sp. 9143b]
MSESGKKDETIRSGDYSGHSGSVHDAVIGYGGEHAGQLVQAGKSSKEKREQLKKEREEREKRKGGQ